MDLKSSVLSSAGPGHDKPDSSGPDHVGASDPVSDEPGQSAFSLYGVWFAASLILALAGGWGLIAGWVFGLPGGGEVRRDVFGDRPLGLRDLFVAIPHPDLAKLPFVPKAGGGGYELREKFHATIEWKAGVLTAPAPPPIQESFNPKQAFNAKKEAQNPKQAQAQEFPAGAAASVPVYMTNLLTARTILTPQQQPDSKRTYCLSVSGPNRSGCIALPSMPLNTPTTVTMQELANVSQTGSDNSLRLIHDVLPDAQDASPRLYLADFFVNADSRPASFVTSVTWGNEATGPSTERPTAWIGGLSGNIFKILLRSEFVLDITRLQVPFADKIDFIAFVSPERGWIWTPSAGENGVSPAAVQTFDGGKSWQRLSYRWLPAPWVFVAFVLGALAFERGTTARIRLKPVATEKYIADHGVSDDPIGQADTDALGLAPIAASMARFLRNTETKPTVAIGVTGPWGCGKTSLMNLVKQELADRGVRTVWFNAWHNQKEENLLAALLVAIRTQAVPPLWTFSGFVSRFHVAWKRIGADPSATVALGLFVLAAGYVLITHLDAAAHLLSQLADWIASLLPGAAPSDAQSVDKVAAKQGASAITSIGLSTGGITALIFAGKKLWDQFKPLASIPADLLSTLNGQSSTKDLDQQLSFRYRFAAEFALFCDTLRRPPYPGLVIFIDDLDRCAPKQTVDILEAINFVTSAGRCFVVLGLDENKVRAAIADSYKDMTLRLDGGDPSRHVAQTPGDLQQQKLADLSEFASRYLEKLIHLVIPVPRSRKDSVELLLGLKQSSNKRAEVPGWRKATKTLAEMFGTALVVGFMLSLAWLAVTLVTRSLTTAATSSVSDTTAPSSVGKQAALPPGAPQGPAPAAAPAPTIAPPTAAELSAAGLTTHDVMGTIPAPAVVATFAFLLLILGFQFAPRLQREPIVSDGPQFKSALEIWIDGISQTHETPRAVKRFVNRLRFMAMRLRDVSAEAKKAGGQAPLDEADLVAMAVIEDLQKDCLGATDDELLTRQTVNDPGKEQAAIILASLQRFRRSFGRDPYANPLALSTYRRLAGLVAEGREADLGTGAADTPRM
ncbi:MAG: hypothetical protein QOJ84_5686 [Bradyrhizobium sp.]|jgi:hypothetical protein|nr:hypothetical protein [Bradyrhizobium sp.]